ncbi:MAG: phospholipase [Gammaproteobacteria bacterium]|nr:phospholipase [Gammaproteobacteria bacterium]
MLAACKQPGELPTGLSIAGEWRDVGELALLSDITYLDQNGRRRSEGEIFDAAFDMIEQARRFILLDMFLYNSFTGRETGVTRALSSELTEKLIAQKKAWPDLQIVLISDPVNTVYGGLESADFKALAAAGIAVVITDLDRLPDSNPLYSFFWRLLIQPFGNSRAETLPNPFGEGRVSVRSWLRMLNFKANHRKVLVADSGDDLVALVVSANAQDASSAHSNIGLRLTGPAAHDLIATENAILAFSGGAPLEVAMPPRRTGSGVTVQVLTESRIRDDILARLDSLGPGDEVDIAMFFLTHRATIRALKRAHARGARLRIVLGPNQTAFGVKRYGIPNVSVAAELRRAGIALRWCDAHGEQCHSKIMIVRRASGEAEISLGSTNYTRRNLDGYNPETNLVLRGAASRQVFRRASAWFEMIWNNEPGRRFTAEYDVHAGDAAWKWLIYRFGEGTGWSTW